MMHLLSNLTHERTVYFGEADSFTILTQRISPHDLLLNIKLASLLYDHVILSAAYFWASPTMHELLPYIHTLISNGDVLPSIRAPSITRDILDYFDRRLIEVDPLITEEIYMSPPLRTTIEVLSQRPIAKEMASLGSFVYVDTGSIEAIFRKVWFEDTLDLRDPDSVYNILLFTGRTTDFDRNLNSLRLLSHITFFSRAAIAQGIINLSLPPQIQAALIQRASDLYLTANALGCKSELLRTARSFSYTQGIHNSTFSLGPLVTANVSLFQRVLEILGIRESEVASISTENLLMIKKSDEFAKFRDFYFRLIRTTILEEQDASNIILQRVIEHAKRERMKSRLITVLKYIKNSSSVLFAFALGAAIQDSIPVAKIVCTGSAVTSTVSHILHRLSWLHDTPVSEFISYMTQQQYRIHLNRQLYR